MTEGQGKKLASAPLRRLATGSMTGHERKGRDGMRSGQNASRSHTSTARRPECQVTELRWPRFSYEAPQDRKGQSVAAFTQFGTAERSALEQISSARLIGKRRVTRALPLFVSNLAHMAVRMSQICDSLPDPPTPFRRPIRAAEGFPADCIIGVGAGRPSPVSLRATAMTEVAVTNEGVSSCQSSAPSSKTVTA